MRSQLKKAFCLAAFLVMLSGAVAAMAAFRGVVNGTRVRVRSTTSTANNSNIIGMVNTPDRVNVIDRKTAGGREWYKITLSNGKTGWIAAQFVDRLDDEGDGGYGGGRQPRGGRDDEDETPKLNMKPAAYGGDDGEEGGERSEPPAPPAGQPQWKGGDDLPKIIEVTATGKAATEEEAERRAWLEAVRQGVGMMVDSTTKVDNDKVSEELIAHSHGTVNKYEIVSSGQRGDIWYVTIVAEVEREVLNSAVRKSLVSTSGNTGAAQHLAAQMLTAEEERKTGVELFEAIVSKFKPEDFITIGVGKIDSIEGRNQDDDRIPVVRWGIQFNLDYYFKVFAPAMNRAFSAVAVEKGRYNYKDENQQKLRAYYKGQKDRYGGVPDGWVSMRTDNNRRCWAIVDKKTSQTWYAVKEKTWQEESFQSAMKSFCRKMGTGDNVNNNAYGYRTFELNFTFFDKNGEEVDNKTTTIDICLFNWDYYASVAFAPRLWVERKLQPLVSYWYTKIDDFDADTLRRIKSVKLEVRVLDQ